MGTAACLDKPSSHTREWDAGTLDRWLDRVWPLCSNAAAREPATVSRWERRGRVVLVLLLVAAFPLAEYRATRARGCDFTQFLAAGRYAVEHGARQPETPLTKYLPSADVPWALLAWLPLPIGMAVWYGIGCATWLGLLHTMRRILPAHSDAARDQAVLTAGLLTTPLALDGLCMGAFHVLMAWWMLAGLLRIGRGRDWSGGILLGLAIWVKLLPIVGVAYLVLKRRWKPALVALACPLVVDAAISFAVFHPQAAWEAHVAWWREEIVGSAGRQMGADENIDEDRLSNQSLPQVLRRTLTHLGVPSAAARERVAVADLSPGQLKLVYLVLLGLLASTVAATCWRPGRVTPPGRWAEESCLVVLATAWISPVLWAYHHVVAAPALAIVMGQGPRQARRAWLLAGLWLASMGLIGWDLARSAGAMLWMSLLVGAVLIRALHDPEPASAVCHCLTAAGSPSSQAT